MEDGVEGRRFLSAPLDDGVIAGLNRALELLTVIDTDGAPASTCPAAPVAKRPFFQFLAAYGAVLVTSSRPVPAREPRRR